MNTRTESVPATGLQEDFIANVGVHFVERAIFQQSSRHRPRQGRDKGAEGTDVGSRSKQIQIMKIKYSIVILLLAAMPHFASAREFHVSVKGNDHNEGASSAPLRTISA